MYYSIQDFIENGIADLEECEKNLMKDPLNWTDQIHFVQQILRRFGAAVISELLEECNTILENSIKRRAFWRMNIMVRQSRQSGVARFFRNYP